VPSDCNKRGGGPGAFGGSRGFDAEFVVQSGFAEGVRGAVTRAARTPSTVPRSFVAVTRDGRLSCAIEATFAERAGRRELDALSVRVQMPVAQRERGLEIAARALERFGGTGYVAVGAARGAAAGLFEAVVCFPDIFPWLAENTVSLPRLLVLDDIPRFGELLNIIGMAHQMQSRCIEPKRFQLRFKPTFAMLQRAFEASVSHGFRSTLYAAALPVTRSLRLEQAVGEGGSSLDIAISRGMSRQPCSPADVEEIDNFLRQWTGFGFASLSWRVRARGVVAPKSADLAQRAPARSTTGLTRPALRLIEGGRSAHAGR
jgi:hypothetical protein